MQKKSVASLGKRRSARSTSITRTSKPATHASATRISRSLLAWYDRHGRKGLPWKKTHDPYHVWLSEIMLQQTQVASVIPYFERFITRFPTIAALARADLNAVLHQWTGLGYYARARNLHRTAQIITRIHRDKFPRDITTVEALPGIGRSTAGAILALAFNQRHAILDGNVKRVLSRYYALDVPVLRGDGNRRLWELAEANTPKTRVADYTQAIMDLGATVCRRTRPQCTQCPLQGGCRACRAGNPQDYPVSVKRSVPPIKNVTMLLIRDQRGRILLNRRPPVGIWGGLWSLPECKHQDVRDWCRTELGLEIEPQAAWPLLRHRFSHFQLDITPQPARLVGAVAHVMEREGMLWYNKDEPNERGFPTPVKRLLEQLKD